jgi:hypothetical protein
VVEVEQLPDRMNNHRKVTTNQRNNRRPGSLGGILVLTMAPVICTADNPSDVDILGADYTDTDEYHFVTRRTNIRSVLLVILDGQHQDPTAQPPLRRSKCATGPTR